MTKCNETTITYKHEVATAHRLLGHPGKCAHLHGHNYVITTELKDGSCAHNGDMVLDFGIAKKVIAEVLDDFYDHAVCLENGDPLIEAIRAADPQTKIMITEGMRPTAENMAYLMFHLIQTALSNRVHLDTVVVSVTVQEAEGQCAIFRKKEG